MNEEQKIADNTNHNWQYRAVSAPARYALLTILAYDPDLFKLMLADQHASQPTVDQSIGPSASEQSNIKKYICEVSKGSCQ
jgi:hypothetical protein